MTTQDNTNRNESVYISNPEETPPILTRTPSRGVRSFSFTENSTNLPSSGKYNFVKFGYINSDNQIDIAFGAGGYPSGTVTNQGVFGYRGNGKGTWTNTSTGLSSLYTWGGLDLKDADGDGYTELYATDEHWGKYGSSGLKVWEYRSGWTSSGTHVSTPHSSGTPDNVVVTNVTGDSKLDLVVANGSSNGLAYFENNGGNPVSWKSRSSGLRTSSEFTAIAVADMNKDNLNDIVAAWYTSSGQHMYIQKTSGNLWQNYNSGLVISYTVLGIAIGDVNNDNHMDVIFGTNGNGLRCKLGDSGGGSGGTSFNWANANTGLPTSSRYAGIKLTDIDLDGDLDIIAPVASGSNGIEIYLGNGSSYPGNNIGWTKATNTNLTSSGIWYCVDCFDINGDGSQDIVAASWGSGIKAYLNNLSVRTDNTPPGTITDLTATSATKNSITINWTAPADNGSNAQSGPAKSYDIRYSTINITLGNWDSTFQCSNEPTPGTPGIKQNYTITGLSPSTQYYMAIRTSDERPNLSPLSKILKHSTLGTVDKKRPGQITDLIAENPTNNSINLTWTAPADNGSKISSGAVIEYDIRYHTEEIVNSTWDSATNCTAPITPGTPGTKEKYKVKGLDSETTYHFAIKARDERPNWAYISNPVNNTTLPDPDLLPPNSINDLVASNPTEDSIDLSWTSVGDDGLAGTAYIYDIRYDIKEITKLTWEFALNCSEIPIPNASGNSEFYKVTSLSANKTYYFAIKVGDEVIRWSGLSNIATNTTLISYDIIPPSKINDLDVTKITETEVTLTWTAPGDDGNNGKISGYEIRYNSTPITESIWPILNLYPTYPVPVSAGGKQTFTVKGLLSSKKYYFAVKAFDERPNYSPVSNVVNATTLTSKDTIPPNKITDLSANSISTNMAELTWTAPGDDDNNGSSTGYDIRFATFSIDDTNWLDTSLVEDEPIPKSAGNSEKYVVTGIFSGTEYYFAIKSYDERPNYSPISNIATTTTYWSDDETAPDKITDLKVVETTQSTATLTWTAPGDDGDTGTANSYDLRYDIKPIRTDGIWKGAKKILELPTPKTPGKSEAFLVEGLDSGTTYYFAIKTADELPNWSPLSNSPSGTTIGKSKPILIISVTPEKTKLDSGENISIEISATSNEDYKPISQVKVELSSNDPRIEIAQSKGETSSNGLFSTMITTYNVILKTEVTLTAKISKEGYVDNSSQIILTIKPLKKETKYDIHISNNDLTISKTNITEGDKIIFNATISNIGDRNATNIIVRFFIDGNQIGNDEQITRLDINKKTLVGKTWTTEKGYHTLKVELTPENIELDYNINNHVAEKPFSVKEKEENGGTPQPPPPNGTKEDKEGVTDNSMLIIIIVIILIVVLMIAFLILSKRKSKKKEPEALEPIREPEPGYIESPDTITPTREEQYVGTVPEISAVSTEVESVPIPMEETQETQGIQQVESTPAEMEPEIIYKESIPPESDQLSDEWETLISPPILETEYKPQEDVPEVQEVQEVQEAPPEVPPEAPPEVPPEAPPEVPPEAPPEVPPEIPQDQQKTITQTDSTSEQVGEDRLPETAETQSIPCPICQSIIPIYSTPCPYCLTELEWE